MLFLHPMLSLKLDGWVKKILKAYRVSVCKKPAVKALCCDQM